MYSAEELLGILGKYLTFGNYAEGSDNIPVHCPFHSPGRLQTTPSFYLYIGPPTDNKFPGAAFCHTCDRGWNLQTLLVELGAPRSEVRAAADINRLYAETAKKRSRVRGGDFVFKNVPEMLLVLYEFKPTQLADIFTDEILRRHEIGFDRTLKRITFPIRDHRGVLVGISGRATRDWQQPRYYIYKEELAQYTPGYSLDKSKVLWGLHLLYETRMRSGKPQPPLIVCEGFKAAMWVAQCGFPNVVAAFGTYISPHQVFLLNRVANDVILFLDNDAPGQAATRKTISRLSRDRNRSFDFKIADYQGRDVSPDDLDLAAVQTAVTEPLTPGAWSDVYGRSTVA